MNLYNLLNIKNTTDINSIDAIYNNIKNKTTEIEFAWKVLRDEYYNLIYKKYNDIDLLFKSGFIKDTLTPEQINFINSYSTTLPITPYNKLLGKIDDNKKQIVLLSTGGFNPIHEGHIEMMELAKKELEKRGFDVIGGYFSISHRDYINTKKDVYNNEFERLQNAQLKISNHEWLMIDPFESIFMPTYVNFTEIIKRLKIFLNKYLSKNIEIAYVFGADNAEFMYCFEQKGIGVCVNRDKNNNLFIKIKNKLENPNCIFINNNSNTSKLSSRNIRKKEIKKNKKYNGKYIIRNEEELPFNNLNYNVKEAQKETFKLFQNILQLYLPEIKVIPKILKHQLSKANVELENKQTISLDTYFKGTYNLEVSRCFELSDKQLTYTNLIGRNSLNLNQQIKNIIPGNYILVDDDTVSGNTLKTIINLLPKNIIINDYYFLAQENDIFDVVDFRDFILGANNGGLMIRTKNEIFRVPYLYPYIDLNSRASIPIDKQLDFSLEILKLNLLFYKSIDDTIEIKDLSEDFQKLATYMGFKITDKIIDFINWHIEIILFLKKIKKSC